MATNFHHIRVRKGESCFTVIVKADTREDALAAAFEILFPVSEGFVVYYSKPARLDKEGIAKPLTELVRRIAPKDMGKCQNMAEPNTYRPRRRP
jgi:hypothetical protein